MLEDEKRAWGEVVSPAPDPTQKVNSSPDELNGSEAEYDESIVEELGALIDDAGLYVTAEIAFQKTRAKLAGESVGKALGYVVLAIILLHIAIIALAVGFVIALAPLVTIWGAIAIVVGAMLLGVGFLAWRAAQRGKLVASLFSSDRPVERVDEDAPGDDA